MLTVVTPATNRKLTTVGTVKAELGITDTAQDARLSALIDRASAMIVGFCGRPFAREVVRETFRDLDGDVLFLSRLPAAVTSVTLNGDALAADGWEADAGAGLLSRLWGGCARAWCGRAAVVEYAAGFTLPGEAEVDGTDPLPAEVEQAAILLVTSLYASAGRDPLLRSESTEGVGSASWLDPKADAGALPPQVASLVSPYRRLLTL